MFRISIPIIYGLFFKKKKCIGGKERSQLDIDMDKIHGSKQRYRSLSWDIIYIYI